MDHRQPLDEHARQVTSNGIEEVDGELSPDNSQVLFTAEASPRLEPNYAWTLFTVPASGGTPTMTLPDLPYAIEHASWAPDSKAIFGLANMGVHSEIFRIDVATHKRREPLTDGRAFGPVLDREPVRQPDGVPVRRTGLGSVTRGRCRSKAARRHA